MCCDNFTGTPVQLLAASALVFAFVVNILGSRSVGWRASVNTETNELYDSIDDIFTLRVTGSVWTFAFGSTECCAEAVRAAASGLARDLELQENLFFLAHVCPDGASNRCKAKGAKKVFLHA